MLKAFFAAGALIVLALWGLGGGPTSSPPSAVLPTAAPNPTNPLPTARPDEVAVEVTDAALTEALEARLVGRPLGDTPLGPVVLARVAVEFRSGQVLTSGEARVGDTRLPVSVASTVDLEDGKPLVFVQQAQAAGVALPASARRAIQDAMQAQLDQALAVRPMRIRSLTVTLGKVLIIGTP